MSDESADRPETPEPIPKYEDRHPGTRNLLQFFEFEHLPPHLREVSRPSWLLAHRMVLVLPDGPELSDGLRNLLRAKDSFVRAALILQGSAFGSWDEADE